MSKAVRWFAVHTTPSVTYSREGQVRTGRDALQVNLQSALRAISSSLHGTLYEQTGWLLRDW